IDTPGPFLGSTLVATGNSYGYWQLTTRDGTVYSFDLQNGELRTITDRYGNTTTITLDGHDPRQQTMVQTPNGRWMTFTWGVCVTANGLECITRVEDNIGRVVTYDYDGQ